MVFLPEVALVYLDHGACINNIERVCSDLFPVEAGIEESCKVSLCYKDHSNFCTPHAASYTLRTGIYLWQEMCFLNYVWHACSQLWSIYPFPGVSYRIQSLLNKMQSCHLLLNPRGIITYFMNFLSTTSFGLFVLKQFYCTSSAPDLANPWRGWNWNAGGSCGLV